MCKLIYSFFACTAFALTSNAAILEIKVLAGDVDASRKCVSTLAEPCSALLEDAMRLIQLPSWQRSLQSNFDGVRVTFAPGTYRLHEPVSLHWGQSLTTDMPLYLVGSGVWGSKNPTILSGAQVVHDVEYIDASNKIKTFDVSAFTPFDEPPVRGFAQPITPVMTELFHGDVVLPVAGWPNAGYGRIRRSSELKMDDHTTFAVHGRDALVWQLEPDLRVFSYWFHDWAAQTYSANVLPDGSLSLSGAGSPYGIKDGQRVRVENALAELDSPGEWYLDRANKKLYVFPERSVHLDYELSIATGLIQIESSRGVTVSNMSFEKMRGDAVTVTNSENVVLDGVSIRHTGNRALVIKGGWRNGIRNSLIEHNGEGGIYLEGGNRKTLVPANHFVEDSVFRDFSRLSKADRFAVEIHGVGQRIFGNKMSDSPYTAIVFYGNDHNIINNEIFNVVQETGDAGAIYVGRDFTSRGTVIKDNFLHDIRPDASEREVKGIYLDDQASGITIRNNVFARVQQPVFIGGGRDNLVECNLFYDSSPAIHLDARGLNWQRPMLLDPKGTLQTRLNAVPYADSLWSARYPHLPEIRSDEFGAPKYNIARGNVVVKGKPFASHKGTVGGIDLGDIFEQGEEVFVRNIPFEGRALRRDFEFKVINNNSIESCRN